MSNSIKAIENDSVHRLNAGQVVLELQGAIKELVENSLDAGASSIDVRIKDHGLDSVEISDNGSGIGEADWPYIGAKHHTSKLPALSTLPHVTTFGFRGEALSSLCALCESVTITTSTKETAPMGTVIRLGKDGSVIDSSTRVARPRGTTVLLTGLFTPLPVRRKEFERTAKREFTKALTQLYAYALVPSCTSPINGRTGVRLKVETIAAGTVNKRTTLLATDGRGSLRSSVMSVWGHKALDGVLDVDLDFEVEVDQLMAKREGLGERLQRVKVYGLISTAAWGQGRTSPDRQFYYVNGRPCDLRQISRAVNEVYRSFNTHQVPLAVLDFHISPESVDINVSPDKRTIFIHNEANLISAFCAALETFWMPSRSSYTVQDITTPAKVSWNSSMHDDRPETETPDRSEPYHNPLTETPGVSGGGGPKDQPTDSSLSTPLLPRRQPSRSDSLRLDEYEEGEPELSQSSTLPISRHNSYTKVSKGSTVPSNSTRNIATLTPLLHESSSQSKRAIERTMDTSKASWSSDMRDKGKASGTAPKTARVNLRERLKGFASQSGGVTLPDQEDDEVEAERVEEPEQGGDDEEDQEEEEGDENETERSGSEDNDGGEEDTRAEPQGEDGFEDTLADGVDVVEEEASRHLTTGDLGEAVEDTSRGRQRSRPIFDGETSDDNATGPLDELFRKVYPASSNSTTIKRAASPTSSDIDQPDSFPTQPAGPSRPAPHSSTTTFRDEIPNLNPSGEISLSFDFPRLRQRYAQVRHPHTPSDTPSRTLLSALSEGTLSSAAGVGNRDAATAEEALSRVIQKRDFERMEVLGQFNKGFIIVRLRDQGDGADDVIGRETGKGKRRAQGKDDLFIVDQHASDEKYNFETLQRTTVIKAQRLIRPRAMQLTAGDEIVAVENMDILRANGFEVDVNEDELPGRGERVKLVAMPVSKETVFDFKDLEQLLHLLGDGARPAGQMVRCSKVRSMFAMRACRKSVMIGKSLTKGQMVQLLRNMGTIDQPWNCPHGRPTMRHLAKIEAPRVKSGAGRIDWSKWTPIE